MRLQSRRFVVCLLLALTCVVLFGVCVKRLDRAVPLSAEELAFVGTWQIMNGDQCADTVTFHRNREYNYGTAPSHDTAVWRFEDSSLIVTCTYPVVVGPVPLMPLAVQNARLPSVFSVHEDTRFAVRFSADRQRMTWKHSDSNQPPLKLKHCADADAAATDDTEP